MKTNEEIIEEFEETVATGKIFDEDGNEITIEVIGFIKAKDEQARLEKIEMVESVPTNTMCFRHAVCQCGLDIGEILQWKQEQLNNLNNK